jgi:hypothetical protein
LYNSFGRTPLHEAVANADQKAVAFLIDKGANVNMATIDARVPLLEPIVGGNNYITGKGGDTCLHLALATGNIQILGLLVDSGKADLSAAHHGWTFLDLALLSQNKSAVELFLGRGIKPTLGQAYRFPSTQVSEGCRKVDFSSLAQQLLSVVTSAQLVPPQELYEIYDHVLSLEGLTDISLWKPAATSDLVEAVVDGLYKVANIKRVIKSMKFCLGCRDFQSNLLHLQDRDHNTLLHAEGSRVKLHDNREQLNECASHGCLLCGLAADALDKGGLDQAPDDSSNFEVSIALDYTVADIFIAKWQKLLRVRCAEKSADLEIREFVEGIECTLEDVVLEDSATGSPHALSVARYWLQICRSATSHTLCQESYRHGGLPPELPTRVLEIGNSENLPVLVETRGASGRYCALSYCWGKHNPAMTTKSNLASHLEGIQISILPQTIQDAIKAARALDFQYIWIDSLCIVQDHEEDFAREASRMHQVYGNADLTISSLVAQDCKDSFFQPRTSRVVRPIPLELFFPKHLRQSWEAGRINQLAAYHPESRPPEDRITRVPVHERGWTLQEHLLSTRILYFGSGALHWHCLCEYATEYDPCSTRGHWSFHPRYDTRDMFYARRMIKGGLKENQGDLLGVWQCQVAEFTRRTLSKSSDRGLAFLAISRYLAKELGNEYVGGIWKGDKLFESLCWSYKQPLLSDPKGPSWTWTLADKEISFEILDTGGRGPKVDVPTRVVLVDINVNQEQSSVSGSVKLKGTLHHTRKNNNGRQASVIFDSNEHLTDESYYAMDMLGFEKSVHREGYNYQIWPGGREAATVRLLLQPVNEEARTFRRIGVGVYDNTSKPQINALDLAQFLERQGMSSMASAFDQIAKGQVPHPPTQWDNDLISSRPDVTITII